MPDAQPEGSLDVHSGALPEAVAGLAFARIAP